MKQMKFVLDKHKIMWGYGYDSIARLTMSWVQAQVVLLQAQYITTYTTSSYVSQLASGNAILYLYYEFDVINTKRLRFSVIYIQKYLTSKVL
jgi:hypothetical protein